MPLTRIDCQRRLLIIGGHEILSAEGTTQGDPLAMGLYALSIQPLITSLQGACKIKQCWFADDVSGAGPCRGNQEVGGTP